MPKKTVFEYQELPEYTIVSLDSRLSDYGFRPVNEEGELKMKTPERTIKDCRHIDGCVYFHLGHVSDAVMIDLIEKFQKLKLEKGWKQNEGVLVPDHKFKIE